MNQLRIIRAGLSSTVQDTGRTGFRHLGIPCGGALDQLSHDLANRLVGNSPDAATIEMTLTGDEIQFADDTLIAITGADMAPFVRDACQVSDACQIAQPVPQNRPVVVTAGCIVRFQAARRGCRCYLAISGGIEVPVVMGSRSTFLRAEFGGYGGRALMAGDEFSSGIPTNAGRKIHSQLSGSSSSSVSIHSSTSGSASTSALIVHPRWFVRPVELPDTETATLRIVEGTHMAMLDSSSREKLVGAGFWVSAQSDRMGYRLMGQPLTFERSEELLSEGVAAGTLQVPPDGNLILLMADCAPTGGYPRIGHVISADLGIAAQLRPGQNVQFSVVSIEVAQQLCIKQRRSIENALTMAYMQNSS